MSTTTERAATEESGFRLTRGGRIFSPWVSEVGLPIYAPADFDLQKRFEAAQATSQEALADEDDLVVASPPPSPLVSSAAAALHDVDALEALDVLPDSCGRVRDGATRSAPPNPAPSFPNALATPPFNTAAMPPSPYALAASSEHPIPASTPSDSKAKAKKSSHTRRRAKRQADAQAQAQVEGRAGGKPVKKAAIKHWKNAVPLCGEKDPSDDEKSIADALARDSSRIDTLTGAPIRTDMSLGMDDVRVASSAFVGQRLEQTKEDTKPMSREDWEALGNDYVAWNGRECRPILTRSGEVLAALGGCPADDNWSEVNEQLKSIFGFLGEHYNFSKGQQEHRRGKFNAVATGISYGGGQQRVSNLAQTPHNQAVLDAVMGKRAVHRIANFGSSIMRLLNPRMYEMYDSTLSELCNRNPSLHRNFPGNPFAAATFNVGPVTVAYGHTDHLNIPNGWCAITAIGEFDSTRGGHLVLPDLKLVIEFPAGSTILIPSALLKHSNTRLHDPSREFRRAVSSDGRLAATSQ